MTNWKHKIYLAVAVLLLVSAIYIWRPLLAQTDKLEVHFFDIGQGDSSLVEEPHNIQVLIDGGPSSVVVSKLGHVMPAGDKTIELVVMTHPDKDHIAGLVDVLKQYKVNAVLATIVEHPLGEYVEIKKLIQEKNIPVISAIAPQRIALGKGSYLDLLYPFDLSDADPNHTNTKTIVARLVYGSKTFLFTGDLEIPQENELLMKNVNVQADVLKVGHHGSKGSSGEKFLQAVRPSIAVISVGLHNRYGHPTPEALSRLSDVGAKIFRTDQQGDVVVTSDGNSLQVLEQ